jgi:hypothetical protein
MTKENRQTISEGTNKAYASIDVAVFDPLMSNEINLDRVAYAFAGLRMSKFFYEEFGTQHTVSASFIGFQESAAVAKARDAANPQRVFKNILQQIWQNAPKKKSKSSYSSMLRYEKYKETTELPDSETREARTNEIYEKIENDAINDLGVVFKNHIERLVENHDGKLDNRITNTLTELEDAIKDGLKQTPIQDEKKSVEGVLKKWKATVDPHQTEDHKINENFESVCKTYSEYYKNKFESKIIDKAFNLLSPTADEIAVAATSLEVADIFGTFWGFSFSAIQRDIFRRRFLQYRCVTPLGMMHRYRQHFFYGPLLRGKCNEIRSVAPFETLEVITASTRTDSIEDSIVNELEVTQSTENTSKNSIDLTERVANTVARVATTNISANGSYNALVWNASGEASQSVTDSTTSSTERISKKLSEITTKQAETIRKKTTTSTRVTKTTTDSITSRHAFENKTDTPMVLGLYSVGHKIESQIQTLGAQLVWQTKVDNPGVTLARSLFLDKVVTPAKIGVTRVSRRASVTTTLHAITSNVYIAEAIETAFDAEIPKESVLRATQHFIAAKKAIEHLIAAKKQSDGTLKPLDLKWPENTYQNLDSSKTATLVPGKPIVEAKVLHAANRLICNHPGGNHGSIHDESSGVRGLPSSSNAELPIGTGGIVNDITIPHLTEHNNSFTLHFIIEFDIPIVLSTGDDFKADDPLSEKAKRKSDIDTLEKQLSQKYQRPRAGLLLEERKTLLANKIATLVRGIPGVTSNSNAMQLLYLRISEIFEIDQLFYDANTFEYDEAVRIAQGTQPPRNPYGIHTAIKDGDLIPAGSSLGWEHQIDGDFQRDMFLNAPFAWVCLPVKPGKEAAANEFLEDFGVVVGQPARFDKIKLELKVLREFERLFPLPPSVKESLGATVVKESTLIKDFLHWWQGTSSKDNPQASRSTTSDNPGFFDWLAGLFSSEQDIAVEQFDCTYNQDKPFEKLREAVAWYAKKERITALDVYTITSVSDSFVPIDGLAIERITLH